MVFRSSVEPATGGFIPLGGKTSLVTPLDVVGFAGEDFERFVPGFSAEPRNGSVVAVSIFVPGDSQLRFKRGAGGFIGQYG